MPASHEEPNDCPLVDACATGPMQPAEHESGRGLRFAHIMIASIEQENRETRAAAWFLAQLLIARGLIGEEEWTRELAGAKSIDIPSA